MGSLGIPDLVMVVVAYGFPLLVLALVVAMVGLPMFVLALVAKARGAAATYALWGLLGYMGLVIGLILILTRPTPQAPHVRF